MKVLFRVDASGEIGSGHLMRCLTMADYLTQSGSQCSFATFDRESVAKKILQSSPHEILLIDKPVDESITELYASWLSSSEAVDFQALQKLVEPGEFDLVVIDHYGIGKTWEQKASEYFDKVFVIDDLGRSHDCDFLLDSTLGTQETDYSDSQIQNSGFFGARYALLRPAFLKLRVEALHKRLTEGTLKNVFVSLGGGQGGVVTERILQSEIFQQWAKDKQIRVLVPRVSKESHEVARLCEAQGFILDNYITDIHKTFLEADVAIGGAGTASYERAALGLPTLMVQVAENQATNINRFRGDGVALTLEQGLDDEAWVEKLESGLKSLDSLEHRRSLVISSSRMVSGFGALQMLSEITQTAVAHLRDVNDADIAQVFQWQCFPGARKNARNPEPPLWEEHQAWFERALKDPAHEIFILSAMDIPVGLLQVHKRDKWEVSILISPAFWGEGLGKRGLRAVREKFPDEKLYAYIKPTNQSSLKLFESSGYLPEGEDWYCNDPTLEPQPARA